MDGLDFAMKCMALGIMSLVFLILVLLLVRMLGWNGAATSARHGAEKKEKTEKRVGQVIE